MSDFFQIHTEDAMFHNKVCNLEKSFCYAIFTTEAVAIFFLPIPRGYLLYNNYINRRLCIDQFNYIAIASCAS